MQFEYDPERLIEEVKKRPGIWDFDNVEYRTKNTRHKLWNEVVNELLQTNVKVSKSEMRELGNHFVLTRRDFGRFLYDHKDYKVISKLPVWNLVKRMLRNQRHDAYIYVPTYICV